MKIVFLLMLSFIFSCSKEKMQSNHNLIEESSPSEVKLIDSNISISESSSNLIEITSLDTKINYNYFVNTDLIGKIKVQINYINGIEFLSNMSTCSSSSYKTIKPGNGCSISLAIDPSKLATGIYPVNIQIYDSFSQTIIKSVYKLINVAIPIDSSNQSNSYSTSSSCKINSHIDGRKCVLNTRVTNCQGSSPLNSTLNNGTTYIQTWLNGSWSSSLSYNHALSGNCTFSCNNSYVFNNATNTCDFVSNVVSVNYDSTVHFDDVNSVYQSGLINPSQENVSNVIQDMNNDSSGYSLNDLSGVGATYRERLINSHLYPTSVIKSNELNKKFEALYIEIQNIKSKIN